MAASNAQHRHVLMTRRLSKIGNSQGLIIPTGVLELLGIDMNTDLELVTDGSGLFVFPAHHPDIKKLRHLPRMELSRYATGDEDE